jgi:hypothetical protein
MDMTKMQNQQHQAAAFGSDIPYRMKEDFGAPSIEEMSLRFRDAYYDMVAEPENQMYREKAINTLAALNQHASDKDELLEITQPDYTEQSKNPETVNDKQKAFFVKHYRAAHRQLMTALSGNAYFDLDARIREMEFCEYKWMNMFGNASSVGAAGE